MKEIREANGLLSREEEEQFKMLQKMQVFHIHGRDKLGRKLLTIRAKFFPGKLRIEVINKYLEEKIYPKLLKKGRFSVLYLHTGVERSENYPGMSALRCIYDSIPGTLKNNLEAVYFLHPGLQSRLFLATFVRLFFSSSGLYGKVKYVSRVDYLWEHIKRNEVELPEYVYDHDEELEYRPMMDYGLESDHARVYGAPSFDNPVASYSMRCIS